MTVDVSDELEVITSPELQSAIKEVLDNAVVHNASETPGITVTVEETAIGFVEFIITDNGSGIPAHEREALTEVVETDLTHSSGIGLWIAKFACKYAGGQFVIPEEQSDGGRVVIELPVPPEHTIDRLLSKARSRVPGGDSSTMVG